ncbi:MAG: hypothetical protein IPJ76_17700 [Flavobacteriales bacterium]|nr:MAG: hypothetical protein IPJ76_17700 [Flavobacteriales bacterium]
MRKIIPLVMVFICAQAFGQEQFGLLNSNYAGTDAVVLNPARMATQWPWLDVNLVGANLHARNNYVFLGKQYSLIGEIRGGIAGTNSDLVIGNELSMRDKKAYVAVEFKGPAIAWSLGSTAIGLSMRSRAAVSAVGVPVSLATFATETFSYEPQHGVRYNEDNFRLAAGAWTEFGLSMAHIISRSNSTLISAGATGKYLMGHAGGALTVDQLDYMVVDTARIEVYGAQAEYGFVVPSMNAGRGFGADIGFEIQRTESEVDNYVPHSAGAGCTPAPYIWRVGVSVVDIGAINYKNAVGGTLNNATASIPDYDELTVDGAEGLDSLFSVDFTGWSGDAAITIGLPTALAVQYDRRVANNVFVAADLVHPLTGTSNMRIRRGATVALVPRYELKRFEAALPIVLQEYRKPTVGLMLRLNSFIIGTDNLLPLLMRTNEYTVDVYARLKITLFRSPHCRGKGRRSSEASAKPGATSVPCTIPTDR